MSLRAVIYARCSTEEEAQKDALVKQAQEAEEWVRKKGWILVDSYIESRSGTSTKNRAEYNRLYGDLLRDHFDILVIKSQDRLMRNTKDWYLFADRLCSAGKRLYMYLEQKFFTPDDALITGIKAILAEEYSRELSRKINNAHAHRQKTGRAVILPSNTYGYRKRPDKSVEIVEEEAAIKRRMYELCAAGYGCRRISAILRQEGVCNRKGKPFADGDILRMIRSPLNKGTVVMHRTHYDFDAKRTVAIPKEEQYWYENRIPAIVSADLWELANRRITERSGKPGESQRYCGGTGRNPGTSPLSGKLRCGLCGEPYYRKARRRYKDRKIIYEWKCKRYLEHGRRNREKTRSEDGAPTADAALGCDNVHIRETDLMDLLRQICEIRIGVDQEAIIGKMMECLRRIRPKSPLSNKPRQQRPQREALKKQMTRLVDQLLDGTLSDAAFETKKGELENTLRSLRGRKEQENCLEKGEKTRRFDDGNVPCGIEREQEKRLLALETKMREEEMVGQAAVAQMLDETEMIRIFPRYMEVIFLKNSGRANHEHCVKVEYGSLFDAAEQKREDREKLLEMVRTNPGLTAGKLAEALGISRWAVNYGIRVLKKEGRLYFCGKGGKGGWAAKD